MSVANYSVQPIWLQILRFPLTRLLVLGAAIFYMMMWNNKFMEITATRPLISIGVTIAMGLAAIAVYVGYGRIVEGREVSELSTSGMGREWAVGALIGGAERELTRVDPRRTGPGR